MFRKIKYPKVHSLAHILSLQQTKHEDNICGTRLVELEVLRNDLKYCSSCKEGKCLLWSSAAIVGKQKLNNSFPTILYNTLFTPIKFTN